MDKTPLDLAFVSDVACPWCAIGLASLEQALARVEGEVPVNLHFEPFELNPDMGPEGAETVRYLADKYGITPEQVGENRARIVARGAAVGFAFGERRHVWNTFAAHRVLHWAGLEGRGRELKRALLRAYHGEGRNPAAPEVLAEMAAQAGLDAARARAIAEGEEFTAEVRARARFWHERGVTAVPTLVVDDRYVIQGGQPPEAFEQALRQVAASR